MLAEELIIDEIPPLKLSDAGIKAIKWMDEFKVSHLPVLENGVYMGLISEADLLDFENPEESIRACADKLNKEYVVANTHVFEVVKAISDHQLSVIPVLNEQKVYLGSISITHLMNVIAAMPVVEAPGGIVILEMNFRDYTLSEIARIVEANDAKILGSLITSNPETSKIQVTLKINKIELDAIIKTLERYKYNIIASYDQSSRDEDLKDRYDMLMNYINM